MNGVVLIESVVEHHKPILQKMNHTHGNGMGFCFLPQTHHQPTQNSHYHNKGIS
jgi:hypothetical protein